MDSRLGDGIQFLGYDVKPEGECSVDDSKRQLSITSPGSCTVHLTLYWQALGIPKANYTVFTHLLAADGQIPAQKDGQPQDGAFPTGDWFPGDIIPDEYTLILPSGTPPGDYGAEVGMYLLETAERLLAFDASGARWPNDAIQLDQSIEVLP
jgi:hypothetical protein